MHQHSKRLCAILLALCMIVGFVPLTAQAALLPGEDYITQQLYLGSDLVLHLRGNVPADYINGASATLTYGDKTDTYTISNMQPDKDGLYDLPVSLAVPQMTDSINLVLKAKYMGINVTAIEETYSIREYLKSLIDGEYTAATKQLAQQTLNYGAWAQKYFGYNTDNLANRGYDADPAYAVPSEAPRINMIGGVSGINYYGSSVVFASSNTVRHYFSAPNGVADYTFTVDGEVKTPVAKDGRYYIEVSGINPQDMVNGMTVKVTDGTDNLTFAYAPIDFFIRSYNAATDETYKTLLAHAYSYFISAQNFAGVSATDPLILEYNAGTAKTLQVSTNLPADTTIADFTFSDNGCNVNENGNVQKASSVSMSSVDGSVMLTFNFANAFSAGQTYKLPGNAIFGFADGGEYSLAEDYLFQFNGTDWTQVNVTGDFTQGVNLENIGNTLLFAGHGASTTYATVQRVSYADLSIGAPVGGGSYALQLSHESSYYPEFTVNFGKKLPAGTKITFDAYGVINGDSSYNHSIFEYVSGGEATVQFGCDSWTTLSFTLANATDHVDLFWNYDRAGLANANTTGQVYVDNFLAVEPVDPVGNVLDGLDFETAGNEGLIVGMGGEYAYRDATVARVPYSYAGIPAPANGGDYVLKMSHGSQYYPTFQLNFGETLKAGTTVTFDVYGTFEGWKSGNDMNIEFTGDSGSGQVVYMIPETWFTATITLTEDRDHLQFFWNIERGNGISGDVASQFYIDNVKAVEPPVEPAGNAVDGYDFETEGHAERFTGIGYAQDATVERASYADLGIASKGGDYAVKLSHSSHYYPTFQMNFGKTLKAGSTVTFDVYGTFEGWKSGNDMNIELTGDSGSGQIAYMIPEGWFTATITLSEATDHLQFFWNIERGNGISGNVASYIIIDNVKAVEPADGPTGDLADGLDFESAGHELRLTGVGYAQDATIERASYADLGIEGKGGSYAAKLSHSSHYYPTFQLNFGRTMEAGTVITFDVYGAFDGWKSGNDMNIELTGDSGSGQIAYMLPEGWFTASVTLSENCDHLQFFWNIERGNGVSGEVASYIIIDNVKAAEPDPTFIKGMDFESASQLNYFGGVGGGNGWRDATFEIVSFDGDNALKLTCASSQWPTFRMNFGRTLPAGTQIFFDAYTDDTSGIRSTVSIFEAMANCTETAQYFHGSWNNLHITLTTDCDHVDLMANMDRWNEPGPANIAIYIDNVIANMPFSHGVDFEDAMDAAFFSGIGQNWSDATIERVAYADLGITAPADGDAYALKLSHGNDQYPTFRINFGQTLKAGTKLKLDIYGHSESNCVVLCYRDPWAQAVYMGVDAWREDFTFEAALAADCSYVDFYWETRLGADAPSYIIIDNIEIVE